jgi:hypothetical protein
MGMTNCGLGAPGRRAWRARRWRQWWWKQGQALWLGPWRRGIAVASVGAVAALGLLSCSETKEPLSWSPATRPGLGDAPETFTCDTLIVANAAYDPSVLTGGGGYLIAGRVVRAQPFAGELTSRAYLKWDLSGLPAGEVTSARIDLILRDVSNADPADPDSFVFQIHEVLETWIEDSLGVKPFPAIGPSLDGGRGVIRVSAVNDSVDVLAADAFRGAGLRQLVTTWRDDEEANRGLAIEPAPGEPQEGFLRFISSEGQPRGISGEVNLNTPLLTVKIAAADGDTTISLEAAADGYVVSAHLPGSDEPIVTPDSLLVLSAGHVQGLLFGFDLPALLASDPARFPAGMAVHQATLRLTPVPDTDWSLATDEDLTVLVYQTETQWTEAQVPTAVTLNVALPSASVSGEDEELVLDVRNAVQAMVEGDDVSLALTCASATSQFRSLLCKSRQAVRGRPELRIVFSAPAAGRLGEGGEGR